MTTGHKLEMTKYFWFYHLIQVKPYKNRSRKLWLTYALLIYPDLNGKIKNILFFPIYDHTQRSALRSKF